MTVQNNISLDLPNVVMQQGFAFSAAFSPISAATAQQLHGGGINRAIRCTQRF